MTSVRSTYRVTALLMAFLMFFTSAGFTMDMHYCGGELKSVSFFGKAKTCHDIAEKSKTDTVAKDCPHHKKMMAEKRVCFENKGCCSNKTVQVQSDQDQKIQTTDFAVSKPLRQFVLAYFVVFFTDEFDLERKATDLALYKPPLIQRDIPVLNQTFLL